jgi:rhodanese-related sulfurtransferase
MAKVSKLGSVLMVAILVVVVYVIYTISQQSQRTKVGPSLKISVGEAKARRFGLIIDVRTPKERELLGYYPNSIPISPDTLSQQVPLDISNKNTWILVYSNGDNRAPAAAEILYRMGYPNVRYIKETYLSLMPGSI